MARQGIAAPSFQVKAPLARTNVPPMQSRESVSASAAECRICQDVEHSSPTMLVCAAIPAAGYAGGNGGRVFLG